MNEVLRAEGIVKCFFDGDDELPVLKGVDLVVHEGERIAILGRSGSGKSTLLHILGGLSDCDSGKVCIDGQSMSDAPSHERARLRNRAMGFVYQFHHLLPEFSALENVAMPLLVGHRRDVDLEARARELLEAVGLGERLSHRPHQLSGGERQRVAVARALATEPRVVLADEPTGNLDRESAAQVVELMLSLSARTGTAFVIVTHDEGIAHDMNRSVVLEDGVLKDYVVGG